jgi:UDP-N-acetylmuramoyl-L-alanyl-D-glutamate--2,6-diaminopimelate ligase
MTLRELISSLDKVTVAGPLDVEVGSLTASSREAGPGCLFAAIRGTSINGHQFIPAALGAGCPAVLAETAPPAGLDAAVCWLHVPDSRLALSQLASRMAGHPWRDLFMTGVTGTNGKTTTAYLLHHVMKTSWHRAGLLGTVLVDDGISVSPAKHTTPGSVELNGLLGAMRDNGCRGVAMEVSSHGIHQHRVSGIGFDACVFTNLTQDHLDYHGTIEEYFKAKAEWFHSLAANPLGKTPVAVINVDDAHGAELAAALEGKMKIIRFGFGVHCDFRANNFRQNPRGMEFELAAKGRTWLVRAPLIGRFNVYNL